MVEQIVEFATSSERSRPNPELVKNSAQKRAKHGIESISENHQSTSNKLTLLEKELVKLPDSSKYERSFMHKDTVSCLKVSPI